MSHVNRGRVILSVLRGTEKMKEQFLKRGKICPKNVLKCKLQIPLIMTESSTEKARIKLLSHDAIIL